MKVKRAKIKKTNVITAIMLALLISVTGIILSGCGSGVTRDKASEKNAADAAGVSAGTVSASDGSVFLDPGDLQAYVTAVDGGSISVSIGGGELNFGGGSQERPDFRTPGGFGGQDGFGGAGGFSDISGGKKDGGDKTDDGNTDAENGSDKSSDSADPRVDGQIPAPPADGSVQTPAPPADGSIQTPAPPADGGIQTPAPPAGGSGFGGSGGGRRGDGKSGRGGVSATLTVSDEGIIFKSDGSEASLSDITAGVSLTITVGECGSVTRIVINGSEADPANTASGGKNL